MSCIIELIMLTFVFSEKIVCIKLKSEIRKWMNKRKKTLSTFILLTRLKEIHVDGCVCECFLVVESWMARGVIFYLGGKLHGNKVNDSRVGANALPWQGDASDTESGGRCRN